MTGTRTKRSLEPGTQKFIDAVTAQGGPPLYTLTKEDARKVLEDAQAIPVTKLDADVEDVVLPTGPSGQVSVRIFRPVSAKGPLPAVMYFHGGGWILGSRNTHDRLLRDLVNLAPAAFVFVNYTPSPEAQYPVPLEECYAAARYIAEHGPDFNIDSTRLAVMGDSVGGYLAAAVTLLAKQRTAPSITFQVLCYPVTDTDFSRESYLTFANGPWLTRPAMQWFWDNYAPNLQDRKQITASPVQASQAELAGLPPALVIVDENDVLRDEGEEYAMKLSEAGVEVIAVRYLATIHDFMMLNGLAATPATRSAIELAAGTLRKALSL